MSQSGNTALASRWFNDVWNTRREETITERLHPDAVGRLVEGWDSWNQGRLMQELQGAPHGVP